MEEAWTFHERNLYSRALMNRVKTFTGAILDSRRDGVQVHASHFSFIRPCLGGVRCRPDPPDSLGALRAPGTKEKRLGHAGRACHRCGSYATAPSSLTTSPVKKYGTAQEQP